MNIFISLKNKMMDLNDFELYFYLAPNPEKASANLFFAHANGVPALTYKIFFQQLAQELNLNIISYDMRGIGKTRIKENIHKKTWSWQTLINDHIFIFEQMKIKIPGKWILGGHSLGAWLSLLASEKLNINELWLFDPPILSPQIILKWLFAIAIRKKHLSPNAKKVRKRKTKYPSYDDAYTKLKKSSFMKNWSSETIYNYLEGSFSQEERAIQLRHNPEWEAHLFEEYPPTAAVGFLKLSSAFRKHLKPLFFVGEKSDTCNPKAKPWVKLFFPQLQWFTLQNGTHMFPIEQPEQTIHLIKTVTI